MKLCENKHNSLIFVYNLQLQEKKQIKGWVVVVNKTRIFQ